MPQNGSLKVTTLVLGGAFLPLSTFDQSLLHPSAKTPLSCLPHLPRHLPPCHHRPRQCPNGLVISDHQLTTENSSRSSGEYRCACPSPVGASSACCMLLSTSINALVGIERQSCEMTGPLPPPRLPSRASFSGLDLLVFGDQQPSTRAHHSSILLQRGLAASLAICQGDNVISTNCSCSMRQLQASAGPRLQHSNAVLIIFRIA